MSSTHSLALRYLRRTQMTQSVTTPLWKATENGSETPIDEADLYKYQRYRWLNDEAHKLAMRYRKFNLPALLSASSRASGSDGNKCVKLLKCVEGQFNKAFILTMSRGDELVARLLKSKRRVCLLYNRIRGCNTPFWNTAAEYAIAIGKNEQKWAESYAQPRMNFYRSLEHHEVPHDYISLLKRYVTLAPYLVSTSMSIEQANRISHPDLHLDNIFVDPTTSEITGIIDWQHVSASPTIMQRLYPQMLELSAAEQSDKYKDERILLDHYLDAVKEADPLRWKTLSEENGQRLFAAWLQLLSKQSPALPLRLANQHRRGKAQAIAVSGFSTGAYNICCTVTFDDGFRALVRFPILGRSRFRTEKIRNEISVMRYLSQQTNIPVPIVLGAGRWGCGPYIVMTFIEGTLLSQRVESSLGLDPTISGPGIENAFHAMAQIMLELSKPTFPCIGALVQESGVWKVVNRPLTLNMNELVRVGNIPPDKFAGGSFGNVLVSDPNFTVAGIIDWEYTYVAPDEFTYAAPWWLLFESPEAWEPDLNEFLSRYTPRLQLFLKVLRSCEDQQIQLQKMDDSQRLSDKMAQSFWFCLAARKSFMFDDIYWTLLDQKYFGRGSLEDRLLLLSQEELDGLEEIVPLKMQQARENVLEEHLTYDQFVDL
ncbi:hypothetical protein ARAM_002106 [Aspergillus rambellii]|uniref:Aminoglycoside phosphotransferase domain-containing protein n=1 Tax=Aspergillus rambellii TaxID=308745 RepID=A0A0F8URA8_9EURO|nr:hypothetical protein ARAM_002106 [Aspergillus rambellii]